MKPSRTMVEAFITAAFMTATAAIVVWFWLDLRPPPPRAEPTSLPQEPLPERAVPVASYTLEARLDPTAHELLGNGTITWRNASKVAVDSLYVHLYMNAFKNDASAFLSDRRPGGRGLGSVSKYGYISVERFAVRNHSTRNLWTEARRADGGIPEDETDMVVPLERPIGPGEQVDIDIAWKTQLPSLVERTGHFGSFHMVGQWFPKIARLEPDGTFAHFAFDRLGEFYADFGTYDVTIDVPIGFVVGATGARLSDETRDGRHLLRHVQADVHDFAFTAYDAFEELQEEVDGVSVRVLYPNGFEAVAREQLEATAFGLRHFGGRFGRYPYATLTLVHPPHGAAEAGGMEYPTLITTGGSWWRRDLFGSARALTLHELGHQYFQGMVATNEWAWPFLDEGLTTWAEVDALEAGWGPASAIALPQGGISASTVLRYAGLAGGHDAVIGRSAPEFESGHAYARLVYARTGLVLETLDRVYEGAIHEALGRYARDHRFAHPGPADLLDSVRAAAGENAAEALHTCLFDRGWIDFAIEDLACDPQGCILVVTRRGNVRLPVDVLWIHVDGSTSTTRWDGESPRATLDGPIAIAGAVIDPDHRVLIDEDLANNAIRSDSFPWAWRTRGLSSFVAALAYSTVLP